MKMMMSPRAIGVHMHHMQPQSRRSSSSRKRSLATSINGPGSNNSFHVPPSVAMLEQVALELSVTKELSDVRYVLSVHHVKSNTKWELARSFDEYRRFQQRVLRVLDHGHFCAAECPWLFSFITSYFPKKHFFRMAHSSCVVTDRRDGLAQFLSTLQTFVLDRTNHTCSVVVNGAAQELVSFIYGDVVVEQPVENLPILVSPSKGVLQHSDSISSTDDEDCHSSCSGSAPICVLCDSSLDAEAHSSRHSIEENSSFVSVSSTDSNRRGSTSNYSYTTTLRCGHQFHDECIVPKLNESLSCPVCGHEAH
ncbi:TPA: hypothetical protein N0F65_001609 [Lagenidium giganteum]|uniref:RING-type domain-containing protein n=1 Tax=Lagenidium giganteum TaxID=4803 RepID=A0AAV2Z9S2_9STRA|nr:TPA: hypothetical protein N0F65_001609 [Lagenidium giganteum]